MPTSGRLSPSLFPAMESCRLIHDRRRPEEDTRNEANSGTDASSRTSEWGETFGLPTVLTGISYVADSFGLCCRRTLRSTAPLLFLPSRRHTFEFFALRLAASDPHETEPESRPAIDSARSLLCGRRAEGEAVSNIRGQDESEAEGHQECRYNAHKDEDREQTLVDEAELESDRRDDELHRPASVHRDSRGHGVSLGKLGPARAEVSADELAQDRRGQDGQDERRVGQALHDDG